MKVRDVWCERCDTKTVESMWKREDGTIVCKFDYCRCGMEPWVAEERLSKGEWVDSDHRIRAKA